MAKLTLSDLTNLQNEGSAIATINNNSTTIETAMENTLSRDGTTPNQMGANLDMNSHRIINLTDAIGNQDAVTLLQMNTAIAATGGGSGGGGGGGAPTTASYVTISNESATLPNSSVLTSGTNIDVAGGGHPATISLNNTALNALGSISASADEVPYFTGGSTSTVTAFPSFGRTLVGTSSAVAGRSALGVVIGTNVQQWSANLDGLSALSSTGIAARTGANTWSVRQLVAPVEGMSISNADAISGNPTFSFANDLGSIEGLSTTGILTRTATDTYVHRTMVVGSSGGMSITQADGVSGNPTFSVNINGLIGKSSPDPTNDLVMIFDNSVLGLKKATIGSLISGLSSAGVTSFNGRSGIVTPTTNDYAVTNLSGMNIANIMGGRLTYGSSTPITTSDMTAQTTLYYTPMNGNLVTIYDGTRFNAYTFPEMSIVLDGTSAHTNYHAATSNFDVFVAFDGASMRIGTGPSWVAGASAGTDNLRGSGASSTAITNTVGGIYTNTNFITLRYGNSTSSTFGVSANRATYLGTMRTGNAGLGHDSTAARYLWNAYNQSRRRMRTVESTASWVYSTATFRPMNNNASNALAFITGLAGSELNAVVLGFPTTSAGAVLVTMGVGINNTTTPSTADQLGSYNTVSSTTGGAQTHVHYRGYPGLGWTLAYALESGAGSDTQTWLGNNVAGIIGDIWG